jgi:hypothetical protein
MLVKMRHHRSELPKHKHIFVFVLAGIASFSHSPSPCSIANTLPTWWVVNGQSEATQLQLLSRFAQQPATSSSCDLYITTCLIAHTPLYSFQHVGGTNGVLAGQAGTSEILPRGTSSFFYHRTTPYVLSPVQLRTEPRSCFTTV